MSWKLKTDDPRHAVWKGEDSVIDPFYDKRRILWYVYTGIYIFLCWMIGPHLVLMPLQMYFEASGFRGTILNLAMMLPWFAALLFTYHLTWNWYQRLVPPVHRFYTRQWTLTAADDGLTFKAGSFDGPMPASEIDARNGASWSATLDAIARVETGLTRDWQPSRRYDGASAHVDGFEMVSPHEYQTYLHMVDGSRRVIQTSNADREGTATLAQSIRSWLEARRSVSSGIPTDTPRIAVDGEGFDL